MAMSVDNKRTNPFSQTEDQLLQMLGESGLNDGTMSKILERMRGAAIAQPALVKALIQGAYNRQITHEQINHFYELLQQESESDDEQHKSEALDQALEINEHRRHVDQEYWQAVIELMHQTIDTPHVNSTAAEANSRFLAGLSTDELKSLASANILTSDVVKETKHADYSLEGALETLTTLVKSLKGLLEKAPAIGGLRDKIVKRIELFESQITTIKDGQDANKAKIAVEEEEAKKSPSQRAAKLLGLPQTKDNTYTRAEINQAFRLALDKEPKDGQSLREARAELLKTAIEDPAPAVEQAPAPAVEQAPAPTVEKAAAPAPIAQPLDLEPTPTAATTTIAALTLLGYQDQFAEIMPSLKTPEGRASLLDAYKSSHPHPNQIQQNALEFLIQQPYPAATCSFAFHDSNRGQNPPTSTPPIPAC